MGVAGSSSGGLGEVGTRREAPPFNGYCSGLILLEVEAGIDRKDELGEALSRVVDVLLCSNIAAAAFTLFGLFTGDSALTPSAKTSDTSSRVSSS